MTGSSSRPVVTATVIGTMLQLAMVISGHFVPAIASQFAAGGMLISGIAGFLYSVLARPAALGAASGGGAAAGGISAFLGILVSCFLGDVEPAVLGFGTAGSAVTGLLGGIVGKLLTARRTA